MDEKGRIFDGISVLELKVQVPPASGYSKNWPQQIALWDIQFFRRYIRRIK